MIEVLKNKIKSLEEKKGSLSGSFEQYELLNHLDVYLKLRSIDYAISVLKEMLLEELQKN